MSPAGPRKIWLLACILCGGAAAQARDMPVFDIEKQCKALPYERSRQWCVKEERCNRRLLSRGWADITGGLSRMAVDSCLELAAAAPVYNYWTLYSCLVAAPEIGRGTCN